MKRLLGLLALVVVLFGSRTAAADEPEADQPKAIVTREWYGWQTLATDGVSFAAMGMGVGSFIHEMNSNHTGDNHATSALLLGAGFGGYVFGAPAVHAAHGHWGKAGASFGMRTGPLALCGMIAIAASGHNSNSNGAAGACGVLLFFGTIATVAIDSAVIAREDVAPPPPSPQVSLAPSYDPRTRAGSVSFAAQF